MNILKEGADIPFLEKLIIASSTTSKLDNIQIRGRVLIIDENNPSKVAEIDDFITIPSPEFFDEEKIKPMYFKRLYKNERKRVEMFAEDALNKDIILTRLNSYRSKWMMY